MGFPARVLPSSSLTCFTSLIIALQGIRTLSAHVCERNLPPSCNISRSYVYDSFILGCPAFTAEYYYGLIDYFYISLNISCTTDKVSNFSELNEMCVGDVDSIAFYRCPLPAIPLSRILQNIDAFHVKRVELKSEFATTVTREFFTGLSTVNDIVLHTNGTTQLHHDIFVDMPELEYIQLYYDNTVLSKYTFRGTPKLKHLVVYSSNLTILEEGVFHNLSLLNQLYIEGNTPNLSRVLFSGLHGLKKIAIVSNKTPVIPQDLFENLIRLQQIMFGKNDLLNLPKNLLRNNKKLERFILQDNKVAINTLPAKLLANLTELNIVELVNSNINTLPEDLLWDSNSIRNLSLANNAFTILPEMLFKDCEILQKLDLSYNRIANLPTLLLHNSRNLKALDLNNNLLTYIEKNTFRHQERLLTINLNNNLLTFGNERISPLYNCSMLQEIHVANNCLTKIFSDWRELKSLEILNLTNNKISKIQAADFVFKSTKDTVIDIRYNNISEIDMFGSGRSYKYAFKTEKAFFSENTYDLVPVKYFYIEGNSINCSCKYYSFLQYDEDQITANITLINGNKSGNSQCVQPEGDIHTRNMGESISIKVFSCLFKRNYLFNCPEKCNCQIRALDAALIVECYQRNITSIPEALPELEFSTYTELILSGNRIKSVKSLAGPGYNKVTKFFLSDNMISEIDLSAFPPHIEVLTLDGNNLRQFNESLAEFIKNKTNLTELTLQNNPWRCDCSTIDFVYILQSNYPTGKIKLLDNITCENGQAILNMSYKELCPDNVSFTVVAFGFILTLLALFGILFGIYYKLQKAIQVWLYAHKCCLWFVTEQELDQNKVYDAFISYSHHDETFVDEQLVPGLEDSPHRYKLCLDYRDWLAGEYIPDQIARSVEESRRTIVVMSPSFLKSVWGKMEFRTAHCQALRERRVRVIIIMYKDVGPTEKLDPELRAYLTMNTYLKWGDPWFWEKLYYALPHSSTTNNEIPLQKRHRRNHNFSDHLMNT